MTTTTPHTWREIVSQPTVWSATLHRIQAETAALQSFFLKGRYDTVVFTGCGSTYYLSLAAAASYAELVGGAARGLPASEIWLNPAALAGSGRTLLVAVSRSGATTETLRAVEHFRQLDLGQILTLSCYADQPLAQLGDVNLVFPEAQEQSIAQTRAFSSLYLATVALAALWGGKPDALDNLGRLSEAGERFWAKAHPLAQQLATNPALQRCFVLGSGSRYGLACELSLKLKEMSLSESEPFHFMEFRHGPQSMAGPNALIIGLVSERLAAQERAVLNEMRALGSTVVAIGPAGSDLPFDLELEDALRGALYLPFGQALAYERALARGLDPDRPHNLDAVVRLDAAG